MPLASHSSALPWSLLAPPHGERDHDRAGQCKPGDGILQVIVLQMDVKRAGFWGAALGHRLLQVDIERRDFTPAERVRHREMIASEPQPFCEIFRPPQHARALL